MSTNDRSAASDTRAPTGALGDLSQVAHALALDVREIKTEIHEGFATALGRPAAIQPSSGP